MAPPTYCRTLCLLVLVATTYACVGHAEPDDAHAVDADDHQRSGSYIGFGAGYLQPRAWLPETDDHGSLSIGPLHSWQVTFRVGDAFTQWFSLGFKVNIANGSDDGRSIGAFSLLLDTAFYPWRGLMLRPNVGLGFGYAQGKRSWEFGGGGPWSFEMTLGYEFRLTRLLGVAPVVSVGYIGGDEFDAFTFFAGVEIIKWFATATG